MDILRESFSILLQTLFIGYGGFGIGSTGTGLSPIQFLKHRDDGGHSTPLGTLYGLRANLANVGIDRLLAFDRVIFSKATSCP